VAEARGHRIALARHPAALADDCINAYILVLDFPAPKGCAGAAHIVDFFALRNDGTHAFYLDAGKGWRVETVAAARGVRPWSPKGTLGTRREPEPRRAASPGVDSDGTRRPQRKAPPRPEVEDDEPGDWDEPE
jgi:competence protein ComEC